VGLPASTVSWRVPAAALVPYEVIVFTQPARRVEVETEDAFAHGPGNFDLLAHDGVSGHHGLGLGPGYPERIVGRLGEERGGPVRPRNFGIAQGRNVVPGDGKSVVSVLGPFQLAVIDAHHQGSGWRSLGRVAPGDRIKERDLPTE
jgi:hypothetical protein